MNADLFDVTAVGIVAIVVASLALVTLVRVDLVPSGRAARLLDGGGRGILAATLGLGIVAFAIKLTVIAVIATFPRQVVAPLIVLSAPPRGEPVAQEVPFVPPRRYGWQALPERAPAPPGNPTTPEKVALGERLFADPNLSSNGKVACASCHDVGRGAGVDGRATAIGVSGVAGKRNAPTVWNAGFQAALFWDGRAASLEEQATGPLLNPDEMGMPSLAEVERRVQGDPAYRPLFDRAFGLDAAITGGRIAAAIAAYERTLITADTPYDRFVRGDTEALTAAQRRGMALFEAIGCVSCHAGPNFSGASLLGARAPYRIFPAAATPFDRRYGLTDDKGKAAPGAERGVWRIPSLRNVALTAPYFHNGSVSDLGEAVRIMATAQLNAVVGDDVRLARDASWSAADKGFTVVKRPYLSERDIEDLVAFLHALSSDRLVSRKMPP